MIEELRQAAEAFMAFEIYGIDPGISNGAIYRHHPKESNEVHHMFSEFDDMVDFFRDEVKRSKLPMAFIEIQNMRKDDKDGKQFGIEKLLRNYTNLIAALKVSEMPFCRVHPQVWQRFLRIYIPGEEKETRKKRFRDIAKTYDILIRPTLWNCDAILLAQFGLAKVTIDPAWIIQNVERPKPR
jgi:hypothetical protein